MRMLKHVYLNLIIQKTKLQLSCSLWAHEFHELVLSYNADMTGSHIRIIFVWYCQDTHRPVIRATFAEKMKIERWAHSVSQQLAVCRKKGLVKWRLPPPGWWAWRPAGLPTLTAKRFLAFSEGWRSVQTPFSSCWCPLRFHLNLQQEKQGKHQHLDRTCPSPSIRWSTITLNPN